VFTGIIEAMAMVLKKSSAGITLERPKKYRALLLGQSIAVNGACLSITHFDAKTMTFDVVPETWSRTNLQEEKEVNLERAMRLSDRLDGHVVTGHIDTVTPLLSRESGKKGEILTFLLSKELSPFVVEKGSVTLNGVALTIAKLTPKTFSVALIPHTSRTTNLGKLKIKETVNVEADLLAKYWYKWRKVQN
jgi:riboflavin synthase